MNNKKVALQIRRRESEIMDQPDLDRDRLECALGGLSRLNRWSGSAAILWPVLRDLAMQLQETDQPNCSKPVTLRILDLATGAGDNPIRLARKARQENLPMRFAGCDVNPHSIEFASRRAQEAGADIDWFVGDVLADDLPVGYDVLMCSLYMHHLSNDQAAYLLGQMWQAASRTVMVCDLVRSRFGLWLATAASRILTRSEVVQTDGPISVRAAYTIHEFSNIANQAGLLEYRIRRSWPARFLLTAHKDPST